MTKRLYYEFPQLKSCTAKTLKCVKTDAGYEALTDQTVIYPEGGGQLCDKGSLSGQRILHAREDGEGVWHLIELPVDEGAEVVIEVDWGARMDHSRQHTGEHILSGLAKSLFGAVNVGFHMAQAYSTIDFDLPLGPDELNKLEDAANMAALDDAPVSVEIVTPQELEGMALRKRAKELEGDIRIVRVGGVDSCTCCGTHCRTSGEAGQIKITSYTKYKGGTRLWFVCGEKALDAHRRAHNALQAIARRFSVKPEDAAAAVARQGDELASAHRRLKQTAALLAEYEARNLMQRAEAMKGVKLITHISHTFTRSELKLLCDALMADGAAKVMMLFAVEGDAVYYCLSCTEGVRLSMQELCRAVNFALNGKGGGRATFAQGSAPKSAALEEAVEQLTQYAGRLLKS